MLKILQKPRYFLLLLVIIYIPIGYLVLNSGHYADEYVYYVMAREIVQGNMPYSDFFCAHMPLMVYSVAFLYLIFEPSIAVGKLVPCISSFFVLFLVYLIGEKFRKNAGVISCFLLLLSANFHLYLSSFYGIFLCLAPLLASFYFHLENRKFLSGLFIALALFVRLNAIPIFLVLLLLNRKEKKFYYGLLATSPMLLFLTVPNFIDNTLLYHMAKTPDSFTQKLFWINRFISRECLIVPLSIIGSVILYAKRKQRISYIQLREWINGEHHTATLIVIPAVFVLFTLNQKVAFDFYFIIITPFLAVLGSLGILHILKMESPYDLIPIILVVLVLSIYTTNYHIINAYKPIDEFDLNEFGGYINENTERNEKIFYLGMASAQVAMKTNREIGNNLIDLTDQRFYIYRDMDDRLLNSLRDNVGIAITSLNYLHHLPEFNPEINLDKTLDYLRRNYYPTRYVYSRAMKELSLVWMPISKREKSGDYIEPVREDRYYYIDACLSKKSDVDFIYDDRIINESFENASRLYINKCLLSGNVMGEKIIADNVIKWPLNSSTYYCVDEGNMVSEVWVSSIENNTIELFVYTTRDNDPISLTRIVYDYEQGVIKEVLSFARTDKKTDERFYPTYHRILLLEDEYKEIKKLLEHLEKGEIPFDRYLMLRRRIVLTEMEKT